VTPGRLTGMKKIAALVALLSLAMAGTAFAGCEICVQSTSAHTRDNATWKHGQPVTVVIEVSRASSTTAFPAASKGVVMELDRERVKCLDLNLTKISESGDSARYAGTFYPFRDGEYDGKVDFGGTPQDIVFTVGTAMTPAPIARSEVVPVTAPQPEPEPAAQPPTITLEGAREMLPLTVAALALILLPLITRGLSAVKVRAE
jgi:hypothetical protein